MDRSNMLDGKHTAGDGTVVDFDARYSVDGWRGVAFYLLGWAREWTAEGWTLDCAGADTHDDPDDPDDHGEACYLYDEPEQVDRTDQVRAVMVGDDAVHVADVEDLTEISADDYCHECGQVGCTADGRPDDGWES